MTTTYPPRASGVPAPEDETDLNRHEHFFQGRDHPRDVCGSWCDVQPLAPLPVPDAAAGTRIAANLAAQEAGQVQARAITAARAAEQIQTFLTPDGVAGIDEDQALAIGHLIAHLSTALTNDPEAAVRWKELTGGIPDLQALREIGDALICYSHALDAEYMVACDNYTISATAQDRAAKAEAAELVTAADAAEIHAEWLETMHDG